MQIELWVTTLATTGLSLMLCLLFMPLAHRIGLLDHPSERKTHGKAVPLTGGTGIFLAMVIAITLATPYGGQTLPLILACQHSLGYNIIGYL